MSNSCRLLAGLLMTGVSLGNALYGAGLTQTCSTPLFPQAATTAIDTACGADGSDGSETNQNQAKNNFCPAGTAKPITIAGMGALQQKVQGNKDINFGNPDTHPLSPTPGPLVNRQAVVALGEGTEVVLQGYVLVARQEGEESVNCESAVPDQPAYHDIHISIVDSATNTDECSGVVVEMIPHHRPASWTQANVEAIATKHLAVRVTGQLMFDSSHTPCVNGAATTGDPSRASLWEVHPIYKFEVCPSGDCSGGGWTTLDGMAPAVKKR